MRPLAVQRDLQTGASPAKTLFNGFTRTGDVMQLLRRVLLCLIAVALGAGPALASDASDTDTAAAGRNELAEIVVTAEKRASTVQETPISMTALIGRCAGAAGHRRPAGDHSRRSRHLDAHRGARPDRARDARTLLLRRIVRDGGLSIWMTIRSRPRLRR